jgi:endonuclease YncB( thermonuclease family)
MPDVIGDNYRRWFIPGRDIDGDTITAESVDLGYFRYARDPNDPIKYRLRRVNSPESNRPASRDAGKAAAAFTVAWVAEHLTHGDGRSLISDTTPPPGKPITDSFGRYLAEIYCAVGHNLSDDLLSSGHAVPYKAK